MRMDRTSAQVLRFAICGVVVSITYIAVTTFLSEASRLPFELALAIGWCAAMCVHFTLQRTFVWARRERYELPFVRQIRRYMLMTVSQFGVTAASTAVLPSLIGLPVQVVYLGTGAVVTLVSFLVLRNGIFHARTASAGTG